MQEQNMQERIMNYNHDAAAAPVITLRDLSKVIGGKAILSNMSVDVEPGSIVGLLGKNGAGKTSLIDVLLGFSPPTSGISRVFGELSFDLPAATKRRIGFVPQQDELLDSLTGAQQLALNAALHPIWDEALVARLAREWEIPLNRRIQVLSGGERQKLATLLALGHEPDLLVLDEPASSLDPVARRQFLRELLEIAESPDRTVLFSTHIVSDLERVASRVWIIRDGRLAWAGDLDTLKDSVVRVTLVARDTLPAELGIDDAVSQRRDGRRAQLVLTGWQDERQRELADRLGVQVTVERLGLEEIFLELHA
jgi:ABC-2 type transport system ATP-binding protein